MRNLILTGGIRHPFEDASMALDAILARAGIASEITTDIEAGIGRLAHQAFDMVTVYALRWRMLGDEKYAPHRAEWAMSLSEASRQALSGYVAGGGALLGVHTAALCFDDWPQWKDLLGGAWIWGQSFHPPRGLVTTRIAPRPHPITAQARGFEVTDEVYSRLALAPGIEPLMTAVAASGSGDQGGEWPVLWARRFGRGRVVYNALGHDRAALENAEHRRIIERSALWALGRLE